MSDADRNSSESRPGPAANPQGGEPRRDPGPVARLRLAIEDRSARVAIIGLGYVGLPLAELFAGAGFPVLGFDVDPRKVEELQAGRSDIGHIASDRVAALCEGDRFQATADFSRLVEVDAILICVPTPLDAHREPDLTAVIETGRVTSMQNPAPLPSVPPIRPESSP